MTCMGCVYYYVDDCVNTNIQKHDKETTVKCVISELNDPEEVKLDEPIVDKSVTPGPMTSDSKGRETRLQSKISALELKNMSLQEEC